MTTLNTSLPTLNQLSPWSVQRPALNPAYSNRSCRWHCSTHSGEFSFHFICSELASAARTPSFGYRRFGRFHCSTLSGILLTEKNRQSEKAHQVWMACALISMGTLNIFHAAVSPGNLFVRLHSTAQFAGGLFFPLVWLPGQISDSPPVKCLPLTLIFGITALGILSILFGEFIPEMVVQEKFSPLARALNILGRIGFLIAASFFMVHYQASSARSGYLFAIH